MRVLETNSRLQSLIGIQREAEMSPGGEYRYSLHRWWDPRKLELAWVCLNPSTADASVDDPTVRKIMGFSSRFGYGGFWLFNVFAYRATDPRQLLRPDVEPVGPENTPWQIAERCKKQGDWQVPIVAFGSIHKRLRRQAVEVMRALEIFRCLGLTKDGWPRHPLMLPYSTKVMTLGPTQWL
jgi:hypothetical protein